MPKEETQPGADAETERHDELVADLLAEAVRLGETKVVSMRWLPPADRDREGCPL